MSLKTETNLPLSSMKIIRMFSQSSQSLQFDLRSLLHPDALLRMMGLKMSNDFELATSVFFSKLTKIDGVKDLGFSLQNKTLKVYAYVNEPNDKAEQQIYDTYGQLLDLFPNTDIELRVFELYGRTKEDLELAES
jgi:hypothetical protein